MARASTAAPARPQADAARSPRRWTLPDGAAFWLAAAMLFALLLASGAPAPLYRVYQEEWGFSTTTLTEVFGVYALVLLVTLLFFGSLSDHLGRRPLMFAGLFVGVVACGVFLVADGVTALYVARSLQGVAVGLATGALGAALLELERKGSGHAPVVTSAAPTAGIAVGALGASALVQYGPARTHLTWWLLLGVFVLATLSVLVMPEPGRRRPGALAALRPSVGVAREGRRAFATALPCLVAVWALGGLYLSLGPSLAAKLADSPNLMWGGIAILLLPGVGAAATVTFYRSSAPTAMLAGCAALVLGVAVTFAAVATGTLWLFLLGTAIAGIGFGPGFTGAYRIAVAPATPDERARLIAAIFTVSYLAFSVPAVLAGVATTHYGLNDTALVYCVAIAVLVTTAAGSLLLRQAAEP